MSSVDIIVPCYNYARYLRGCVASILVQEGVQVRVLIIDDASEDHTPEVGRALAREDGRVEYRRHVLNLGHIETYNEGIDWSRADYTLLLSADDLLTPGSLERAARLMDRHDGVGLAYGNVIKIHDDDIRNIPVVVSNKYSIMTGSDFVVNCCAGDSYGENIVPTPTAVVRTAIQKELGGYRKDLPHTGDFEMWLRFAARCSVGKIESEQAYYRFHVNNMNKSYVGIKDVMQRLAAWDAFFQGLSGRIDHADRLRRLSRRRVAEGAFWLASGAFDRGEKEACRELLDYALSIDNSLASWSSWQRLRVKRALGPALWGLIRPLAKSLNGRPRCTPSPLSPVGGA